MSNMLLALEITALGMGLVFAAIILLWGMMSLLTAVTAEKTDPTPQIATDSAVSASPVEENFKARAAAVAVAIALAEQQVSSAQQLSEVPTVIVSAWQLGMRTRQMYQKSVSIRRRIS
jgi:Na+-transporting methylmalonyl-CoA/oxaloacetate decarboxylase gamma subunit